MSNIKTKVAMTTEETSPGVPYWGANQVVTEVPDGQTEVALENLVAGRRYYVKTWNEDQYGTKSTAIVRVIPAATPTRLAPFSVSANGVLDEDSPMYAYVKVPNIVSAVTEAVFSLAFRQFSANARTASASGALTSDSGGGSTSGSGGGSTSGGGGGHVHTWAHWESDTPGTTGFSSRKYEEDGGSTQFNLTSSTSGGYLGTDTTSDHTHSTPNHAHSTPDHQHTVPSHTHGLTYGTYEESFPSSHSVTVKTYQRMAGSWVLRDTISGLTGNLEDFDLTDVITGSGDWRISIQSAGGQPNDGRLGCDLYGVITTVI